MQLSIKNDYLNTFQIEISKFYNYNVKYFGQKFTLANRVQMTAFLKLYEILMM